MQIGYSSFRSVPVRVRRELLLQGLAGLEQVRGMAQNVFPQLDHFAHKLLPEGEAGAHPQVPHRVGSQVPEPNEPQAMNRLEENPDQAYQKRV